MLNISWIQPQKMKMGKDDFFIDALLKNNQED
jgi:hypothetical protein